MPKRAGTGASLPATAMEASWERVRARAGGVVRCGAVREGAAGRDAARAVSQCARRSSHGTQHNTTRLQVRWAKAVA
jgi:hypothetical protein